MTTRQYSSRSQQTTLTGAITSGATSITVVSGTALLGGVTIPAGRTFTLVIDVDTALEEIVDATAVSTNTFTITRGIDGSTAQDHSAGAVVRHMAIGRDYRDANLHAEATGSYNDGGGNAHDMHGIASGEGVVVGTLKTQTLTNKTLTSPTISNPTFTGTPSAGASIVFEGSTADDYETTLTVEEPTQDNTITLPNTGGTVVIVNASQTLTNKTLTSPIISGSPTITGLSSAGMVSSSATPKDYVDSILGSATAAATSAASAATSAASAATSATSAANSATTAANSATAATTSASSAATSASSAATSATAAATSATSAAASATTASNSASAAATSATSAATSASSALTSANSASTSATSAANSATASATSASAAATSATSAATSASSAATSASSALTSANSAAVSAASAAAAVTTAIQASIIDAKGDLIVGTGNDTVSRLAAASTNGYLLAVNSATATGLEWQSAPAGYLAPTIGTTVITSGTTVSTIESVTLSNATLSGTLTAGATSGTNGYLLTSTGSGVQWAAAPVSLPSQTGNDGKALVTNGTTASWSGAVPVAQTTEPTTLIDGLIWIDTDGTVVGQNQTRWSKAPAGGTTSLSGVDDNGLTLSYTTGYEQVYRNGVLLSRGNDYTATNGTSVTLIDATIAGDIIEIFASAVLALTDVYTQSQSDNKYATITTAQTLTNKTLTSPVINTATVTGGTIADAVVRGLEEDVNVVASAATGTINFDVSTASVWYYTSNATANHTLNFRYSSGTSLNSAMAVGDAITLVWLNTNGSTAYYPNVIQIDGTTVTPKVPLAITGGNASAIDAYSFTIIKTASATFTVLETQTKFA